MNVMSNIKVVTTTQGYILYYMNIDAAIEKFSQNLSENMAQICEILNIDIPKLLEIKNAHVSSMNIR